MGRWIDSLYDVEVKVTGNFQGTTLGMTQRELEGVLRSRGARVVHDIRRTTDLLIRAESAQWKYGKFGDREAELAQHRRRGSSGVVIDADDLVALLDGISVWARDPLEAPPEDAPLGTPYTAAAATTGIPTSLFERDPAALERAFAGHARTQDQLAALLARIGVDAVSPATSSIQFDLAWPFGGSIWVAEVKSLSGQNEAIQMRLALGQVLDYAWRLAKRHGRATRMVIAAERAPTDPAWSEICAAAGVVLTWPPYEGLEAALLGAQD